jgi:uncharacterized protein (TIGR03790 family)
MFVRAILLSLFLANVSHATELAPPIKRSPGEVLLIYNANSPISKSVADDYAAKRSISNVLAIRCADSAISTDNETLPLADYIALVEKPVRDYLAAHPEIQFIVLTKGVPIRIEGAETGSRPDDSSSDTPLHSSVDGHLAAMDYQDIPGASKISITGSGATGFGWLNRYWNSREPFSHAKFGGYIVTRLDGYTEADAKALVTRALAAEKGLGTGEMLFDVQPIFGLGDPTAPPRKLEPVTIAKEWEWSEYNAEMQRGDAYVKTRGIREELDLNDKFVGDRHDLLGYFSWGSNDARYNSDSYQSLTFAPGSIADTAVSTSARTFLPTQGGQSLLVDLIAHGLTCGKGDTDEPLLQSNASPSILLEHYTSGYNMAESFYAASRFVGWQDIVIGDPLCCPYPAKK